jgi:dipeptidyl aminopeptidase/acylaminoacyl peptidase
MKKIGRSAEAMSGLVLVLAMLGGGLVPPGRAQERKQSAPNSSTQKSNDLKAESHIPDPPGKIAFASDRDGNFEIYVMNADGGGLTRLTNNPAEDTHPTWSPDGTRLAFVSNRDGNKEIYVMGADGSGVTRLTNNSDEDLEPAWSPALTNQKIAFVSHRDGNDEIYVMNPDGTGQTNLSQNTADDTSPAWAPSGTLLAFDSNRDGDKWEIYRMNSDGSNVLRLTNNSANDVSPSWPAGKISFQTDRDTNDEIYTMNVDGSSQTRITNNAAFDIDPARSSDGARLVWVSDRDAANNLEIYTANADGSNIIRLTNNAASDIDPAIQPLPSAATLGTIQLAAATFTVAEDQGSIAIGVTRTGGTGAALVDIATVNGTASDRSDFTPIFRTLTFAPGDTTKTVNIAIIDDVFVEGDETFGVTLGNATGSVLGSPSAATVTITDNDTGTPTTNPIDGAPFFVRQHYLDFLNREPDPDGLAFWTNEITKCGTDATCVNRRRVDVSAAFFASPEFQETGGFVIRSYRASFNRRPTYAEFLEDISRLSDLAGNKLSFLEEFVTRPEFAALYATVTNAQYVDTLNTNSGNSLTTAERNTLVAGLNNGTESRASVLRQLADNAAFRQSQFNSAFVLMQYIGYLRRDPDAGGLAFWLNVLNTTGNFRGMVCAFITSAEYQARFSPVRTRNDTVCATIGP